MKTSPLSPIRMTEGKIDANYPSTAKLAKRSHFRHRTPMLWESNKRGSNGSLGSPLGSGRNSRDEFQVPRHGGNMTVLKNSCM